MTNTTNSASLVQFKQDLNHYEKNIKNLLHQANITPLQFMTIVVNCIQQSPKLLECERNSVMGAVLACAELGLKPTKEQGEAYILPYFDSKTKTFQAQLQIGYQGFQTLMYRNGGIKSLWAEIVRKNDDFHIELGSEPKLVHRPSLEDRGEPVGAYAVAVINGHRVFKYMSEADIMKIKDISQAGDKSFSPWNSKNDPEKWMWKKTCIKQLSKTLPKSEGLSKGVYYDNVCETGGYMQMNEKKEADVQESEVFKESEEKEPYTTFEADKDLFKESLEKGATGKEILEKISSKFDVDEETKIKIESMTEENFDSLFPNPSKNDTPKKKTTAK